MTKEPEILKEAVAKLREYSGLSVKVEEGESWGDALIIIDDSFEFVANVKSTVTIGNKTSTFLLLRSNSDESGFPAIIVTEYIPSEIAKEYVAGGINYLDIAGNCSIKNNSLIIQIEGKKRERIARANQPRAFQEAGIKIIFPLLTNPENIHLTYRELALLANVSLGSVGSVIQELIDLNFILIVGKKKVLKNMRLLLERWVTAYHDVLRPRLLQKKMRFTNPEQLYNWEQIPIQDADGIVRWGGEPGASLLTSRLSPELFTIYTNESWQSLMHDLKIVPADDGEIEVLKMFWKEKESYRDEGYFAPPLVIYADLMGSRFGRNIETATIILENELSNIK